MWTLFNLDLKWGVAIHRKSWRPRQNRRSWPSCFSGIPNIQPAFLSVSIFLNLLFVDVSPSVSFFLPMSHARPFQGSLQLASDPWTLACNYKGSMGSRSAQLEVCINMHKRGYTHIHTHIQYTGTGGGWQGGVSLWLYFSQMTQLSVKTTERNGPQNPSTNLFRCLLSLTPSILQSFGALMVLLTEYSLLIQNYPTQAEIQK